MAPLPTAKPSVPPGAFPGSGAAAPMSSQSPRPSAAPQPAAFKEPTPPPDYDYVPDMMSGGMPTAASRIPQRVVICLVGIGFLFFGFNIGKAWSNRKQLNISLRDSMIVQYEMDKAVKLFDELDAVVSSAIFKAGKREYDKKHLEFLVNKVKESPIQPQLFTGRSYKNFGRKASIALANYGTRWAALCYTVGQHIEKTRANEPVLMEFNAKLQKSLKTSYGVVFERGKKDLLANVVYVGAPQEKKKKILFPIGMTPAPTGDDAREPYNPPPEEGDKGELTESPEKYMIVVAPEAKIGLLVGSGKAKFDEYVARLDDIRGKMKTMRDDQTSLTRMLAELASQNPASIAPPDSEAEFRMYVAQDAKAGAGSAPGK
jgi:hypothetical protein